MYQANYAFLRSIILLATLLCLQGLAVPRAYAGATEWVGIKVSNGYLLVETEIAGIPGYSLIDTGAEVNAINGGFLEAAKLDFDKGRFVEIAGVFGTERRDTYKEVPVKIFGGNVNFHDLVDLDLGVPDIQMILGATFLERFIFQFDYPNQRLRLITRDSLDLKKLRNVDSKKDRNGGSPLVKVGLSKKIDAWLVMDTGANGGILIDRDLARQLNWLDGSDRIQGKVSGVNSSGDMEHFTVPRIVFGPVELADVLVTIPAPGQSVTLFEKYAPLGTRIARGGKAKGLLGYDVLQHFVVTVDYKTGYVHIHAGGKSAE
jgi:hypothetical protein